LTGLRERQKKRRRIQIINAAQALVRKTGGTDFTMKELAETAEVSPATLYNLLGSKDGVLSTLLAQQIEQTLEKGLQVKSDDPVEFIESATVSAVNILSRGSTPLTRTVLKEPKTSDLAEQLYDAFVGYETAQYSRTDPLALHQVSGTIDEQHARA